MNNQKVLLFASGFLLGVFFCFILRASPVSQPAVQDSSQVVRTRILEPHGLLPKGDAPTSFSENGKDSPHGNGQEHLLRVDLDPTLLAKLSVNIFMRGIELNPAVTGFYKISLDKQRLLNKAIKDLYVELRQFEAKHASLLVDSSGDEYLRIDPYNGLEVVQSKFQEKISKILEDPSIGYQVGNLILASPSMGALGKYREDVSVRTVNNNGKETTSVERILYDAEGHIVYIDRNDLANHTIRAAYSNLIPEEQ